jgi:hypothetical protein
VIWYIEATVELILNVITPLIQGKVNQVEVTAEAESEYVNKVQEACRKGVWGSACNTYYVTKNGWNHTMYPWSEYHTQPVPLLLTAHRHRTPFWYTNISKHGTSLEMLSK